MGCRVEFTALTFCRPLTGCLPRLRPPTDEMMKETDLNNNAIVSSSKSSTGAPQGVQSMAPSVNNQRFPSRDGSVTEWLIHSLVEEKVWVQRKLEAITGKLRLSLIIILFDEGKRWRIERFRLCLLYVVHGEPFTVHIPFRVTDNEYFILACLYFSTAIYLIIFSNSFLVKIHIYF